MDIVLLSARAGVAGRGVDHNFRELWTLYSDIVAELQFFQSQMTFV